MALLGFLSLEALFSARALGIALWIGLAVLTVSLLVLMRTRFGQAKPLSKCVVLSVLAHVLLLGYAYGTRLIFDLPPAGAGDFIRLTIDADDQHPATEKDQQPLEPWQQFATGAEPQPDIDLPQRQDAQMQAQVRRADDPDRPLAVGGPALESQQLAVPHPQPALPDRDDVLRQTQSAAQATPLQPPQSKRQGDVDPVQPSVAEFQPRQRIEDNSPSPTRAAPSDLPAGLAHLTPRAQQLDQSPDQADKADAVASSRDDVEAAADRDRQGSDAAAATPDNRTAANAAASAGANSGIDTDPPRRSAIVNALENTPGVQRRLGDGAELPNLYRLRQAHNRLRIVEQQGGDARTEAAVEAALAWLAAHQEADGRWDADRHGAGLEQRVLGHDRGGAGAEADTGITGLALLAFLGAGHSHLEGKYRQNVQRGLEYLLRKQTAGGNLAGDAKLFAKMYCHGMASLALSEAFAMTGDQRLRPFVENAVAYSVASQHPRSGGWRYQPGDDGDMSQFGWQVMALKSAEQAGLAIPARTQSGMLRFLSSVSSGRHGGLSSYRAGEGPSRTMTAEGLVCRVFLSQTENPATVREATDYLAKELPADGQANLYYWYYATLALYQTQGELWPHWNRALKRELLKRQRNEGDLAGSWDTDTRWGCYGGRAYSTAMAALCLEIYYRYLPVYGGGD